MADKSLYAWSPILAGEKSAKYGDEVTEAKLGITKEDLKDLVDSKAVRPKEASGTSRGLAGFGY